MPHVPSRDAQYPQAEQPHGGALQECRHSAIPQSHANHKETDRVVSGIAEEVEGIGLERRRTCGETRRDLNGEHHRIDGQHGPQDAPVALVPAVWVYGLVTTRCAHDLALDNNPELGKKPDGEAI